MMVQPLTPARSRMSVTNAWCSPSRMISSFLRGLKLRFFIISGTPPDMPFQSRRRGNGGGGKPKKKKKKNKKKSFFFPFAVFSFFSSSSLCSSSFFFFFFLFFSCSDSGVYL